MQNSHCLLGLVSTTNLQRNLTASIRLRHSGCDWGRLRWFQYHLGWQSHSLVYWDSQNTNTEWPWSRGGIEKYFFFIHYCTMHQTLKCAREKTIAEWFTLELISCLTFIEKHIFCRKPSWNKPNQTEVWPGIPSLLKLQVEMLCLRFVEFTNFATCGFGLGIGFLHGNSHPVPKVVFFPNIGMNVW